MTAEDMTTQALRKQVSELTLRLKELGEENRDLREICNENGIQYAERLAARRHKRDFAHLCDKHPIGRTTTASDVLVAGPIVRGIAECAGSVLRTGLIARCFFAAFTYLTAQFPWKFGGRLSATLEGHEGEVYSLAVLEGGRLASGSADCTIKIWDVATRACEATLTGHEGWVGSLAVLEGGRLASGSHDQTIKIWDLTTSACVATLEGHKGSVFCLAPLQDGRLASGAVDQKIKIWDVATGACVATLTGTGRGHD